MTQENLNLEQRVNDLGVLKGYSAVNQFRKNENKEKYQDYQMLEVLGDVLNKNVNEAVERQKDFLIDSYVKAVNENLITKTIEEINKQKSEQGISEEQKNELDKVSELAVYQKVGMALTSLGINKEYGDKEARSLYTELKEIFKLKTDDEKEAYVRDSSLKGSGLSSNAQNFRVKWNGNNQLNMQTSAYARDLGKRFVKKTSYGYEINQDELKKAFGNRETYLDIARNIETKE